MEHGASQTSTKHEAQVFHKIQRIRLMTMERKFSLETLNYFQQINLLQLYEGINIKQYRMLENLMTAN